MLITVTRIESDGKSTLGELLIDGAHECYTLEDAYHPKKIPGETRIPAGAYQVALKTSGPKHEQYKKSPKYKDIHRGMLELRNVPGYTGILIHVGNSHDDTDGCLLVGVGWTKHEGHYFVTRSVDAYRALYPKVLAALQRRERVTIDVSGDEPAAPPADPNPLVA